MHCAVHVGPPRAVPGGNGGTLAQYIPYAPQMTNDMGTVAWGLSGLPPFRVVFSQATVSALLPLCSTVLYSSLLHTAISLAVLEVYHGCTSALVFSQATVSAALPLCTGGLLHSVIPPQKDFVLSLYWHAVTVCIGVPSQK